nr:hypothetical protein [uncultured bacterium]
MISAGAGPRRRGARRCEALLQAVRHHGVGRDEAQVAGKHDVEAPVENARQRLEGEAPHHDRLAHGDRPEIAHVAAQMPGQVPAPADGAVLAHGDDESDDGRFARTGSAHTATGALMAGCGS